MTQGSYTSQNPTPCSVNIYNNGWQENTSGKVVLLLPLLSDAGLIHLSDTPSLQHEQIAILYSDEGGALGCIFLLAMPADKGTSCLGLNIHREV